MKVLLTFTGFHDPYGVGLVGNDEQAGPVLSLVRESAFDKLIIFSTPNTEKNTSATQEALRISAPGLIIERRDLPLDDPTDYTAILHELRNHIREICDETPQADYFVSVTSGTPQMHACWVLLAASGEIPARILNVRPARFISKDRPLIAETNLASSEFPTVRTHLRLSEQLEDAPPDFDTVVQELGIVGDHPEMRRALEIGATLAPTEAPILILGETGTGKELFARFVHSLSGRPREKFVPLNCGAIPGELVESVLFGHKKGSFTGAASDQTGKFDQADGGTLFLDELGELPSATQTKLLRVLQDGVIEPLGAKRPHKVDVRIVAATNQNLSKAIKRGSFREDLYFRLNLGEIVLPPLRDRRSDIPKIALHVLDAVNRRQKRPKRLSQDALARLQNQRWAGNVRDLQNVLERSLLLCKKDVLDADDLIISEPTRGGDPLSALPEPQQGFSLDEYLSSARKQLLLRALEIAKNNQSEAARLLNISPQAVNKFLREQQ
jgi:transcriptional regulator with PAS, ATPase and Fis domain